MLEKIEVQKLTHGVTGAHGRLRVFSMYVDFHASIRARWANSIIGKIAGQNWITSAEMWKLDSVDASPAIGNMITGEAAKADILLVAISSLNYRQHELIDWLETLVTRPTERQNTGLLIGMFGDDDDHASELKWTVNKCQHCARPMNRDFVWRFTQTGTMADNSWLEGQLQPFLGRKRTSVDTVLLSGLPQSFQVSSPAC